jgi:hypothetical protein
MTQNVQKRTVLSPRQEAAALALASGATRKGAASSVGVAARTIKEWATLPLFKQRVHELRLDMTKRAIGILSASAAGFAQTLLAASKKAPKHRDRAAAAKAGLDVLTRLNEKIVLEERVAALEEQSQSARARIA